MNSESRSSIDYVLLVVECEHVTLSSGRVRRILRGEPCLSGLLDLVSGDLML